MRNLGIGGVSERFGTFELLSSSGVIEDPSRFVVVVMIRLVSILVGFRGRGYAEGFSCYAEGDELSGGIV